MTRKTQEKKNSTDSAYFPATKYDSKQPIRSNKQCWRDWKTYKMIGWLIKQYYMWLLKSYLRKGNSTFLTTQ